MDDKPTRPGSDSLKGDDDLIAAARQQAEGWSPPSSETETTPPAESVGKVPVRFRDLPSDSFPGFEIVKEIHRGGQGVVYQAVQKATRRKVAIKVMHEGPFAGPRDRVRFEREVQILAALKHPNIVAIHDSGTSAGHFFYVMDYISGLALDQYMASTTEGTGNRKQGTGKYGVGLSVESTLKLFGKICDAVNAAHLKGVIHRDLKPGNIRIDDNGEPHVLDFGLAKVVTSDSDAVLMTMTGQFIGSLPWSSPEQAEGKPGKIDVRTDVYSLGVVLYQMLTGKFPYEVVGNMRDILDNVLRAVPIRPSTIRRQINDEIETIVLKCLAKERERRYQTAGELARDIQRYLAGEPIEAKRDSVGYVLRKQLSRYKLHAGVAAGFVLLITVGLIVSTALWRQAAAQRERAKGEAAAAELARQAESHARVAEAEHRQRADVERDRATKAAERALRVQRFLQDMLGSIDPDSGRGAALTVRQVLDQAAEKIEAGFADQPDIKVVLHETIGKTYFSLGLFEPAIEQLQSAVELRRGHVSEDPLALADALSLLAQSLTTDPAKRETALSHCRQALLIYAERLPETDLRVGGARSLEAKLLAPARLESVENWTTRLLPLLLVLTDEQLSRLPAQWAEAKRLHSAGDAAAARTILSQWCTAFFARLRDQCSAGQQDAAIEYFRQFYTPMLDLPFLRPVVPLMLINTASYMKRGGDDARLIEMLLREAVVVGRDVWGSDHPHVAWALSDLALLLNEEGRPGEAAPPAREALALRRKLLGDEDSGVGESMNLLAEILESNRDYAAAAEVRREQLEIARRRQPPDETALSIALALLGRSLVQYERYPDAESPLRECLEIRQRILPDGHPQAWLRYSAMSLLGGALAGQGKFSRAEPLLIEGYQKMEPPQADGARKGEALERVAKLYESWNAAEPDKGYADKAAEWRSKLPAAD